MYGTARHQISSVNACLGNSLFGDILVQVLDADGPHGAVGPPSPISIHGVSLGSPQRLQQLEPRFYRNGYGWKLICENKHVMQSYIVQSLYMHVLRTYAM